MNLYKYQFIATCPTNGDPILYTLELSTSGRMIHVEHIKAACAMHKSAFHESIADALTRTFPDCLQVLRATHHGVEIETMRGNI